MLPKQNVLWCCTQFHNITGFFFCHLERQQWISRRSSLRAEPRSRGTFFRRTWSLGWSNRSFDWSELILALASQNPVRFRGIRKGPRPQGDPMATEDFWIIPPDPGIPSWSRMALAGECVPCHGDSFFKAHSTTALSPDSATSGGGLQQSWFLLWRIPKMDGFMVIELVCGSCFVSQILLVLLEKDVCFAATRNPFQMGGNIQHHGRVLDNHWPWMHCMGYQGCFLCQHFLWEYHGTRQLWTGWIAGNTVKF